MSIINPSTPIEEYTMEGNKFFVKREDLASNSPAPSLSKLRGVYQRLLKVKKDGYTEVGVLDTRISKSGWGCAAVANEIGGLKITNFYPHLVNYVDIPYNQVKVKGLSHNIYALKGGRTAVLYSQAKKITESKGGYMMPMGLVVEESVVANEEIAKNIHGKYLGGDVVVCIGSGMITAGLILGLSDKVNHIYAISAGMNTNKQHKRIKEVTGKDVPDNVDLILPEGVGYYEREEINTPFPSSPYYDAKAYRWMIENFNKLKSPVLFWNIGC